MRLIPIDGQIENDCRLYMPVEHLLSRVVVFITARPMYMYVGQREYVIHAEDNEMMLLQYSSLSAFTGFFKTSIETGL